MWVGGRHSDWLPGPVRDALVGDERHRGRPARRSTGCTTPTTARSRSRQLADDAIAGVVAKLGDRFSNYFDPAQYKRFKDAQNSEFSGVGLQVSRHPKGLRVDAVYDGSPAKRAGLRQGDVIVAADGHELAGLLAAGVRRPRQGPAGQRGAPDLGARRQAHARKTVSRSTVTVPVVASQLRTRGRLPGRRRAPVAVQLGRARRGLRRAAQAAEARRQGLRARPARQRRRPRVRGAAHRQRPSSRTGRSSRRAGARSRSRRCAPPATRSCPRRRSSVLVNGDTASASEIVTGALQDRDRAKVVGTETFGKGVFQEVLELSNGGALDITAGQYFTPKGRNLGGKGVSTGQGDHPRRPGQGRPQDEDRRGARPGDGRRRRQVPDLTDAPPRVVLLEQRGRFLVGEPFFERGRRATVERSRDARPGRLALLHPDAEGRALQDRARARAPRRRPRRHRGADARPRAAALVPGRGRARPPPTRRPPDVAAPRPHGPADLHHRPRHRARLRRRDLVRGARRRALARLGAHRRRLRPTCGPGGAVDREAYRRSTSVYVPGAVEPMLPEALSNDACSLRPGVDRLAVTVEMELRGAQTVKAAFYRSLIRSDERLDYDRVDRHLRRRGGRGGAVGASRSRRRARRRRRCRRAARAAARWPSSPSSPSSPSTAAGTSSRRWRPSRPSPTGSSST